MALSHRWTISVRSDAGAALSESTTYTGDAEVNCSDTATAGTTREIDVNVDVSQVVSFYIKSTKDVTLKTNVFATPAQSLPLVANKALVWNTDRSDTCPLTVDITKMFFDNTGGADDAVVTASFLLNVGS